MKLEGINRFGELKLIFLKKLIKRNYSKSSRTLSLLDVPVGTGRWIPLIEKITSKYVGVDVSENMINQAQQKLKRMFRTI